MKLSYRNRSIVKFIRYSGFVIFIMAQTNYLSYSQVLAEETFKIHEKCFSEELYISTDRDLYAAGENVWFKIYKLNSLTNMPTSFGKVVYLDILDLENNPVDQLKIEITGFTGSGDFTLPDTLRTGNYILRSYTNWMQNFSKNLFAYKSISVINPFDKITNLKNPYSDRSADSVIFYPEGDHIMAGFKTRLGFKVIDRNGNAVKLSGSLVDDKNDTLVRVKTGINGYGFVSFMPTGTNRIFLVISDKNQNRKFPLPDIQKEGIIISSIQKNENSQAVARLNFSSNFKPDGGNIYLEIYSSGLSGLRKTLIPEKYHELNISSNDIPNGISHLMAVDEHGNILTDRWIAKRNSNSVSYKINLSKNEYAPREKIEIEITANDLRGNPVESDLSISVVKSVTSKRKIMGFEHCRQLPGMAPVIEDCDLADVNDYLIFYKPHELLPIHKANPDEYAPAYLPELEGHLISGSIRDRITGEPLRNENITLSFVGKAALCLFTKTDTTGNFNFVTNDFGLKEIVIQPLTQQKNCYVDLNNPFTSADNDYDHGSFCLDTGKLDAVNNVIICMQINNIYELSYQNPINSLTNRTRPDFYGKPDNSILISNYIELSSVKEIVAELMPGVITTRNNGRINFRLTKPYQTRPFENGPLVLVDGVPVYDLEKVVGINANDIEQVDVLIDRYYTSGIVIDGILHFISKKGNLSAYDLDRSVFRMEYDLLKKKDELYSPVYLLDSLKKDHLPDFRNTLYWNPDLHTDATGKASAEFYSSDESMDYIINVEGISTEGKTGSSSLPLIIKRR
jgi:hypothetical protein